MDQKQPTEVDFAIGRRLSARRKEMDMSQQVMGDALGVSFQQIQKYEKGSSRVSASRLFEIAKLLGVSIPYFFVEVLAASGMAEEGTDPPTPPMDRDSRELFELFARIREKGLKRQVIETAKSLAEKSEKKR